MAKTKIQPIGGNVLIQPISEETTTMGGIVLPDTISKEKPQKGKVIALGSGRRDEKGNPIPFSVKIGDSVFFKNSFSAEEFKMGEEEYLIMDESSILAIIN